MTKKLDVLVVENRRRAANDAIAALTAAGHRVHRCLSSDGPGFPCTAIVEPGSCPIDTGIDVVLAVRSGIEPRPTRYEVGVGCAIRAGVPIAEQGTDALDPFATWVGGRAAGDDEVVAVVEAVAEAGFDDLRASIASRIAPLLPAGVDPADVRCEFERSGHRFAIHLYGPEVGERVEQTITVRVLDAVWCAHHNHQQIDVSYHAPSRR
jgi:hypothetical protein